MSFGAIAPLVLGYAIANPTYVKRLFVGWAMPTKTQKSSDSGVIFCKKFDPPSLNEGGIKTRS